MPGEQDITYEKQESVNIGKLDENESSSAAINDSKKGEPDNYYYDEIDRKCTLRKSSSKIILHRRRTKYKGKRIFDISIALLGIVGLLLIIFYIIISARGGWSRSNFYDVNTGNRITLILVGIFVLFISCIGMLGSYTYWKPIILMTTLLSGLAFISHFYLAKKFMDITRFADRDMAVQWWDVYRDEDIMSIEEEFNCCGYLNYKDHAFVTPNCPKELVIIEAPSDVHLVASVKKNDSYQRKYGTPENPKNVVEDTSEVTGTTTTVDETANNGNVENTIENVDNTTTDQTVDNGTVDNGAVDNGVVDNGVVDNGAVDNGTVENQGGNDEGGDGDEDDDEGVWKRKREIEIEAMLPEEQAKEAEKLKQDIDFSIARISRIGKGALALPIKKRGLSITEDVDDKALEQLGEDIKINMSIGQGRIMKGGIKKRYEPVFSKNRKRNMSKENVITPLVKRQEEGTVDLASTVKGCRNSIVDKVKSGITPLYIILFLLLIVYALVFISSFIYWADLRNEKEYDEFS